MNKLIKDLANDLANDLNLEEKAVFAILHAAPKKIQSYLKNGDTFLVKNFGKLFYRERHAYKKQNNLIVEKNKKTAPKKVKIKKAKLLKFKASPTTKIFEE